MFLEGGGRERLLWPALPLPARSSASLFVSQISQFHAHCIAATMSPTVFREKGYRFYFFSLEEDRMHVHVACSDGDAKFWLAPKIELAIQHGLASHRLNEIQKIIEDHRDELTNAWREHLGS